MIRQCKDRDFEAIYDVINDATKAYTVLFLPTDTSTVWQGISQSMKLRQVSYFGDRGK